MSAGFLGRNGLFWQFIASWFVPVIMANAYLVLALTSETDATGWAWMSIGLAFVLVMWFLFRTLTKGASRARAMAVGDSELLAQIDKRPLSAAAALELRGEWASTLAAVARAQPKKPVDRVLAMTLQIGALVETGEVAKAREVLDAMMPLLTNLHPRLQGASHIAAKGAAGRVLAAERRNVEALEVLQGVIDDIRTGQRTRALAHHYAARAAAADGQHARADQHRAKAAALAPGAWFVDKV